MGTLYVCATPLGNLEDASPRLIRTLKEVDRIVAEDTRVTLKLLHSFDIQKPLISFFRHNVVRRLPELLGYLEAGETLALVTDAGVPGISGHRHWTRAETHSPTTAYPGVSVCRRRSE